MHIGLYSAVNYHDCDKSNKINFYDYYPMVLRLLCLHFVVEYSSRINFSLIQNASK